MSDPAGASFDGQSIADRLEAGPDNRLAGKVETFEFPMEPEAKALIVTAPREAFEQLEDFAVAALDRLVVLRGLERGLMVTALRAAEWPPLTEERLGEIFEHVDYQFPPDLDAVMNDQFDTGWILDDTWDLKSVIYTTSSNLVGLFWVTYV
jgi:hypothetical protein